MIFNLRKYISPDIKERIINSFPYRLYSRFQLLNPEIRFSVELTTKCNAKCSMCTRQRLVDKKCLWVGEINKNILEKIIKEMDKFSKHGHKVVFTPMGLGEPLMYSNLFPLIKRVKKKGIKVILVTNGILLNKINVKKILESGVDEVSVSLNSKDKKGYLKMNGVDAYDVVVSNIKNLLRIKKSFKNCNTRVFIQYLGEDISSFDRDIKEWNKLMTNDDKCYVHRIVNQAGLANNEKGYVDFPCNQPLFRIAIKINGDVYPCDPALYSGSNKFKSLYLGNVMNGSIYKDFIDKKGKRYKILDKMRKDDYKNLECCKICTTKALAGNCFFSTGKKKINGYKWI